MTRFFTILLFFGLISVQSLVIDESHTILKKSSYYKKAIENFKHFCQLLDENKKIYVCRETFADQTFALPLYPYVHLLQLVNDKVYQHKEDVIAYFKGTHELLVPTTSMTPEEIKQIKSPAVDKIEQF
jgi:hypothetical protein